MFPPARRTKIPGGKGRSALTGTIFDVYSEEGKAFWVSTSEGITRYTPSLWRPPPGMEEFDLPVSSIAEDRQGRLWMSATDYVLELAGDKWTRHDLTRRFPHSYGSDQ